ncbi:MAG: leucyl aminopeptidase [Gemmatimonadaceae bacterium]|nr:leucyl aminopeptidase [Gemmatimonadaceae bacterium]
MSLEISARAGRPAAAATPLLACLVVAGEGMPAALREIDKSLGGALRRSFDRRDFRANRDETFHLVGGRKGPRRILLVGAGKPRERALALRRAATLAARQAHRLGVGALTVLAAGMSNDEVEQVAIGAQLGAWEYSELKTPPPDAERRDPLSAITLLVDDVRQTAGAIAAAGALGAGYALARRLANTPGNVCTPDHLTEAARDIGKRHGLKVTVLGRKEMEKEKMGSFLCVAQATTQDPRLVAIEYRKGPKGAAPIVLVGKGLCFDTGGISIKPAERMEFMKFDMCGAAGVLGAMEAIARLGLAVNVVGVFGATTNMPGSNAVKPGDVVTASSGKTIEIINTDAEGRLVLADVLHWVRRYEPAAVIDAATLTGACVIALGNTTTGALGNDDALVAEVIAASRRAAEPAWQLPLTDEYKEQIRSVVADIKNTGGRAAGTITAAAFLNEFVAYPWVHLDIAGTAYTESDLTVIPVGATGVPVGTFVEFVRRRVT